MIDLNNLNPEQRRAAEALEGPVLILAGAGSGKTKTLTSRVANLMDHGVQGYHILALTFTNKAAEEMRERILAMVGSEASRCWISTFHSACFRILTRDIEKIGYGSRFVVYDDDDQRTLFKEIYKRLNIDDKFITSREMRSVISEAKNNMLGPDEWFKQSSQDLRCETIRGFYMEYEKRLKALNALDYDDLLLKTLELFVTHPPVLQAYQERFQYILIDEYQDTNTVQYLLIKLLAQKNRNLCVVGDDDQSIYGWRGANIQNILGFEKDFPEALVIRLEQNYRSTGNILDAANQVIAHNARRKDKKLWTDAEEGEKIHLYVAGDDRGEAAWVATRIKELIQKGEDYRDIAVLYRTNAQSRSVEEMLASSGIPYQVYGGQKFYERKEIKDIICYLRVLVNASDDLSLRRIINVPRRSIGDSTIQVLEDSAREKGIPLYSTLVDIPESLASRPRKCVQDFADIMLELSCMIHEESMSKFMEYLIEKTGLIAQYEKEKTEENQGRIDNIREFMTGVKQFEEQHENATMEDFLENVALVTDMDRAESNSGFVMLMTLHSAKGLEFPNVFMIGMEENVFPTFRSLYDEAKLEEERRLCYVGMTRARKRLYMSRANSRPNFSQVAYNEPSRFLEEIPRRLIDDELAAKREKAFGREIIQPHPVAKQSFHPIKHPGDPLNVRRTDPLNIPGVTKGLVSSKARNTPVSVEYHPGDHVMHNKFGEGVVQALIGEGPSQTIRIAFVSNDVREFNLSLAPIFKLEES